MDRDQLLEQALGLGEEGNWQAAAELLRDHLEDFSEDAAVHCWLGVAEQELGMGGVAYERFKYALSFGTEDPYVLATAGNGIAYFDDPDAEQTLRTASMQAMRPGRMRATPRVRMPPTRVGRTPTGPPPTPGRHPRAAACPTTVP